MNRYCFSLLNENEQKIYKQISDGIAGLSSYIRIYDASKEKISNIIRAVLTDNPQFFWFEGRVSARKEEDSFFIMPHYLYDHSEIETAGQQIENILPELNCCKAASDYDKAKTSYDWLLEKVIYSTENGGQNIHNAFIERKAVCKGLSKAYQYMLSRLGVFCTLADGTIDGVARHIWNIAEIGGSFYHVDVSLGYAAFDHLFDGSQKSDRYRMFLKSDAEMLRTHRWRSTECCPHLICNNIYKRGI